MVSTLDTVSSVLGTIQLSWVYYHIFHCVLGKYTSLWQWHLSLYLTPVYKWMPANFVLGVNALANFRRQTPGPWTKIKSANAPLPGLNISKCPLLPGGCAPLELINALPAREGEGVEVVTQYNRNWDKLHRYGLFGRLSIYTLSGRYTQQAVINTPYKWKVGCSHYIRFSRDKQAEARDKFQRYIHLINQAREP